MTPEQFSHYTTHGYNRIPLFREILADLETPLSTYLKLADAPHSYLLESVHGGEKWGRYSIIGLPCQTVIKITGNDIIIEQSGQPTKHEKADDPLHWIESFKAQFRVPEVADLPRFNGGLVGYFGYDTIRYIEPKLASTAPPDALGTPDILLMVSDRVVVFDNLSGKLFLIVHIDPNQASYDAGMAELNQLESQLRHGESIYKHLNHERKEVHEADFTSEFTRERFEAAVKKAKQYIIDGDVMQVVLSQRLSIPYFAPALDLYRALRCLNPSPYMYHFNLGDFHIVGSSPEILVRQEDKKITVRPIAGTRPRGHDEQSDEQFEKDLLSDPKELAEHLMLIDLGRNDVGRIAEIGSVQVTEKMIIERYSHVMHIVSNVVGRLSENKSSMDVLRATFPAGTVSGAPKIRAMQIIDELEPVKRGIYAGAIGYLSWSGHMDTAIAIRTAVIKDNTLYIQVGAGIVHDSIPEKEWEETMNKGRAIFKAVALAENALEEKR